LKSLQQKRIPPPSFVLLDQLIAYNPKYKDKAEALAKNVHLVYIQVVNVTTLSPVVNDYVTRLYNMIPFININHFFNLLCCFKYSHILPNNKAPNLNRISTTMLKNCFFQIILQLYYQNIAIKWHICDI